MTPNRTAKEAAGILEWIGGSTMLATASQEADAAVKDRGFIFRRPLRSAHPDGKRRFAEWMQTARDKSGVYLIRANGSGELLYIGESHTDRLKDTITRHFRSWSDTAERLHFTFDPAAVTVATIYTAPAAAVEKQNELIQEHAPKFNTNTGEEYEGDQETSHDENSPF